MEESVFEVRENLNQIDQSILAKAFIGELVAQDTNDESASILLERIKGGRKKRPGVTNFNEFHDNSKQNDFESA